MVKSNANHQFKENLLKSEFKKFKIAKVDMRSLLQIRSLKDHVQPEDNQSHWRM